MADDAPAPARGTRRRAPARPRRSGLALWGAIGGGGAVVLVGLWLATRGGSEPGALLDVEWPANRPAGDPIAVNHAVAAGDAFETAIEVRGIIALSIEHAQPGQGMRLDADLRAREEVAAATTEGAGLVSRRTYTVSSIKTDLPGLKQDVWSALSSAGGDPAAIEFRRGADGRPLRGSAAPVVAGPAAVEILERLLAGFSDPTAEWVPPRPVRVGEVWDLAEVVDLDPIARVAPWAGGVSGAGFPNVSVRGRAWAVGKEPAESVERGAGESLRVSFRALASMDGKVESPAVPGSVSLAAKIEGDAWVSLATGIAVKTRVFAALECRYAGENGITAERKVAHRVATTTARAPK